MNKEDLVKEFDRLIQAHYSEEIDSRDEWLREVIYLKDKVVKNLTIPVVSNNEVAVCYTCQTTKGTKPKGDNYCNMCDHYF